MIKLVADTIRESQKELRVRAKKCLNELTLQLNANTAVMRASHNETMVNRRIIKKIEKRIVDLKERMAMNTWDIEEGENSSFKKYSRGDNVCCRKWLKEAEKELKDALRGN